MFSLLAFIACQTNESGRKQLNIVPDDQMAKLGDQAYTQLKQKNKLSSNTTQNKFITCITSNILTAMGEDPKAWEINVFQDDSANAFALPGKHMGIHTGMFKISSVPDELAAVIGHEIAHVILEHGAERASQAMLYQGGMTVATLVLAGNGATPKDQLLLGALGLGAQFGVLLPFSRKHETEADELGLKYAAKAGFDPMGAAKLWQKMSAGNGGGPPEFLSTHPSPASRIKNLQKLASKTSVVGNRPNCGSI